MWHVCMYVGRQQMAANSRLVAVGEARGCISNNANTLHNLGNRDPVAWAMLCKRLASTEGNRSALGGVAEIRAIQRIVP